MLFDPVSASPDVAHDTGIGWQSSSPAFAGDRPSSHFLTLPVLGDRVPHGASYKWPTTAAMADVIRAQFEHGQLRASDVHAPVDARDAFNQAFSAWLDRQGVERRQLQYVPQVLDVPSAKAAIEMQYDDQDFEFTSELYLSFELGDENVISLADCMPALNAAHPLLVSTLLSILDQVSHKTVLLRTPGWFLCEFACRNWEGDETATDEEARSFLEDMCGDDEEAVARLLPSAVCPDIYPDAIRFAHVVEGQQQSLPLPGASELLALRERADETVAQICDELAALVLLVKRSRCRDVLTAGRDGWPIYSASTVVIDNNARISELLDDHFNMAMQGGDHTYCSRFIPFATEPRAVRQQYDDWALGIRMLNHVDRLLSLLSLFDEDTP